MKRRKAAKSNFADSDMHDRIPGKIIVISAPSGAGKTTLLNYLLSNNSNLVYSISATTRQPRPGEKDGVDYFFLSEEEFKEKIEKNEFAEWEIVHGNYYGTPCTFIDTNIREGRNIIMDIDVYGKTKFDKRYPHASGILVVPPSVRSLEKRLYSRGSDDEETIRIRLSNALKEMEYAKEKGKYEYVVVNDDLEQAEKDITGIVKDIIEN